MSDFDRFKHAYAIATAGLAMQRLGIVSVEGVAQVRTSDLTPDEQDAIRYLIAHRQGDSDVHLGS